MGMIFNKEPEFRATADLDADLTAQLKRIDVELAALARAEAQEAVANPAPAAAPAAPQASPVQAKPAPARA